MKYSCLSKNFSIISQPSDFLLTRPQMYLIVLSGYQGELLHSLPQALFLSMPASKVRMYSQATTICLYKWSNTEETMLEKLLIDSDLQERRRFEILIDTANIEFSNSTIISILKFIESGSLQSIAISIGCSTNWTQADIRIMCAILNNTKASLTVYIEPRKLSDKREGHLISQKWLVYLLSELASIWGSERIIPLTILE